MTIYTSLFYMKSSLNHTERKKHKVTVLIYDAFLETVHIKDRYELLNNDDHYQILLKNKRDP